MKEEIDVKQVLKKQFKVILISSVNFWGSTLYWHIYSKELFPVIATSRKYDYYLKRNSVKKTLFTDCRVLVHVLNPNLYKKKA
eukprot:snap_masked-scaffold_59-processed-gene-0.91-mRNA-1 protein AED:1.00 eAED:1.00 QI:0/-1/0/0/-1/1/1/0/82